MSPIKIGTTDIGLYDNNGKRLVVHVGSTLIDSGVVITGNEQVIQLPASVYQKGGGLLGWSFFMNNRRPAIDDGLKQNASDNRFFSYLSIGNNGSVELSINDSVSGERDRDGQDLSDTFETNGQIVISSGGSTLTIDMEDYSDRTEPYGLSVGSTAIAFFNAVSGRSGNQSATLTLRDYTG